MDQHKPEPENVWQLQQAKARLSELIHRAEVDGAQRITRHGEEIAVVISKEKYDQLTGPRQSIIEFFRNAPLPELDLPIERNRDLPREIDL